jgi:3-methyladenine DNA glycosylase/8-oxoguanine DNA glycosylase
LIVNKNIAKFKISMYDALAVDVDQTLYYLTNIHSCLKLRESLSSFCKIFQCIVSAVLQQYVNIFFIFKSINELHNMLVL